MTSLSAFAAIALAAQAPAAPAETGGPTLPALNRMCSPAGAMQYAFGEKGVPGSTRVEQIISRGFKMPATFAPFERAQPMSTAWSGQLFQMTYSLKIDDEAEAQAIMSDIGATLEQGGWAKVDKNIDNTSFYEMSAIGWLSFERPVEVNGETTKVFLSLDHGFGEMSLTCSRQDLSRAQFDEAFGKLPPGTPRPEMPEVAIPLALTPARCTTEPVLAEMQSLLAEERFADNFSAKMLERTSYRDRLTTWMIWKLDQSGKIDTMEIVGLVLEAAGFASPDGNPLAALEKVIDMMPIVERLDAADKADDPGALCLGLVDFQEWMKEVDAITSRQSDASHAALEAKARELGVSLN